MHGDSPSKLCGFLSTLGHKMIKNCVVLFHTMEVNGEQRLQSY